MIGSQRRKWRGYTNLGPVRIPPLPPFIFMTDREDGTIWQLSHDTDDDHVGIDDSGIGTKVHYELYGPYDGPWIYADPPIRMLIRDGRLGYDIPDATDLAVKYSNGAIMTREGNTAASFEIKLPSEDTTGLRAPWRAPGDVLAFEEFDF